MKSIVYVLDNHTELQKSLISQTDLELGECQIRSFPDGENYVRIITECKNKEVIILCSLFRPNEYLMSLLSFADTARKMGAAKVGLVAPYLGYMRQDKEFQSGEAITSKTFAKVISNYFDWLITVDPHLHRYKSLDEIYSIPNKVIHAAPAIAEWIGEKVKNPILIGPDIESEQWVSEIANLVSCDYQVLLKTRHSDTEVSITLPDINMCQSKQIILMDDIASTGNTLIKATEHINDLKLSPPICIVVHPLFVNNADSILEKVGVKQIVSVNTIRHSTNQIDISSLLLKEFK